MTLLILIASLFSFSAHAKGAFAFATNPDGTWVVSAEWNQPTSVVAEDRATALCRAKGGLNCSVIREVSGECISIAVTNEGRYKFGVGDDQIEAQSRSVAACLSTNPGDSCIVRKSFCDNSTTNLFPCRDDDGFSACLLQGRPGPGGATERRQYCRMAFC